MMMEKKLKRDEFLLRIGGLPNGTHYSSIICDKTFFDIAQMEELHDGYLDLQIKTEIQDKNVQVDFNFKGYVVAACDRCLDDVKVPMDFSESLVVKMVENPAAFDNQQDDNLWIINENDPTIDIFHFVYESILLALPMKIVHPDDENGNSTCNPEILKKLNELTAKEDDTDPRWDALKDLKLDE
ncbi:MAG: DUF177 domain-containing protein [Bacteroidales bacterium]|nr:DUF177 domain-containing protein [Bacteroidales bacterium]